MAISKRIGDDLLYEALLQNEAYTHEAANAIDGKASQIFAAAAFLAVQPAVLLVQPHIWLRVMITQLIGCAALLVAFVCAHLVLRVTSYSVPGFSESWRDNEIASADSTATEDEVRGTILWGLIEQAKKRIASGDAINETKLQQLNVARIATISALALNVLSLILFLTIAHASS